MKACSKCSILKELTEYIIDKRYKQGVHSICKCCQSAWKKEWKKRNKDVIREKDSKYREINKEKLKEYNYKYREENKYSKRKNSHLKWAFNITLDDYNNMLNKQNNSCAICGISRSSLKKDLYVDHCHKTGKIRELLCDGCNRGMGQFKDNIDLMSKALTYLEKHNG